MDPLLTSKMPSDSQAVAAQTEKPQHYTYLKEFRTQQCPLFLQHKCTQHRPYTCFHWHFMNQRRRRPIRKKDGTFNYSPDTYCTKYDETTGICPEGDDCPNLHRTAGDTERRYHLRYYKTCTCVYETDTRGHCAKNGPHCAFAHGTHDLRQAVHDVRELSTGEGESVLAESPLGSSLEKDRIINEDPRWNDTNYVLANYKTEQCKRPPRLCRQGYACPSFHNSRDKRRSPRKYKYRSTPCPNVKHGDDWGDPQQCENGDNCAYCHTRTEQQFHPEIYKSTKCNDMVQNSYCPRGPFCAFAHVEQEMTTQRDMSTPADNPLAAFVTNALPAVSPTDEISLTDEVQNGDRSVMVKIECSKAKTSTVSDVNCGLLSMKNGLGDMGGLGICCNNDVTFPEPIGKGRASSFSGSLTLDPGLDSKKAPGCEREDHSKLLQHLHAIECDPNIDNHEKSKRKHNLVLLNSLNKLASSPHTSSSGFGSSLGTSPSSTLSPSMSGSTMSPHATSFYPPRETVQSVIGNALDEDLNLGDLSLSSLEREMGIDNDNDSNSVGSSMSTGFPTPTGYVGATSVPVTIPSGGDYQRNRLGSLSQSPCSSPIGSIPKAQFSLQHQKQAIHEAAAAFLSQPNPGKFSAPGYPEFASMSPRGTSAGSSSIPQSPLIGSTPIFSCMNGYGSAPSTAPDVMRLKEEVSSYKGKLAQWEEGMAQARSACDAWKKEAEEANRKARLANKERDEAVIQVAKLQQELELVRAAALAKYIQRMGELDSLPFDKFQSLAASFTSMCLACQDKTRPVRLSPCRHFALCELCMSTGGARECPLCHSKQLPPTNPGLVLPM